MAAGRSLLGGFGGLLGVAGALRRSTARLRKPSFVVICREPWMNRRLCFLCEGALLSAPAAPAASRDVPERDMLLHAVSLLEGCLALAPQQSSAASRQPRTGGGSSCSGAAAASSDMGPALLVSLQPGVESALRWHMRLNQLLPWFAAEGLATAALLAEGRRSVQGGCVPAQQVAARALWLRALLAPEIDTGEPHHPFCEVSRANESQAAAVQSRPARTSTHAACRGGCSMRACQCFYCHAVAHFVFASLLSPFLKLPDPVPCSRRAALSPKALRSKGAFLEVLSSMEAQGAVVGIPGACGSEAGLRLASMGAHTLFLALRGWLLKSFRRGHACAGSSD